MDEKGHFDPIPVLFLLLVRSFFSQCLNNPLEQSAVIHHPFTVQSTPANALPSIISTLLPDPPGPLFSASSHASPATHTHPLITPNFSLYLLCPLPRSHPIHLHTLSNNLPVPETPSFTLQLQLVLFPHSASLHCPDLL